jgi:Cd2+/Zn2+-exporting ATPase
MNKTDKFRVRGMDCAEEVNALKGTVGKLTGVVNLNFNLLDGIMTVEYDPGLLSDEAIMRSIRDAGLDAEVLGTSQPSIPDDTQSSWWDKHGRALMCWCSGGFIAAGLLSHALMHDGWIHAVAGGESISQHVFPPLVIFLYTLAVVTGSWFVVPKAWNALRHFRADMNLLMTIAVIGAMIIGEWFEAGTVAFLFSLSLLLESWSVGRARHAIRALISLTPVTARTICEHHGDIEEKPVALVPLGATVIVRPGERIPLDGVVTKGRTSINQAPITGESIPVAKQAGDEVFAGTINQDGAIEFKTTKAATDTTLARIISMVEDAQSRRASVEQWVETFARYYTPAMILLAIAVALIPPLFVGQWDQWFYEALVMLVIACPCALVISTPVSIVAGLTAAARAGVLIKGGVFLESMANVKVFALDKTGTITMGTPEVQEILPFSGHTRQELLARAAALEAHSEHPLAAAILRAARAENVQPLVAENFQALKGRGAEATIDGRNYWVGSHRLLHEKGGEDDAMHAEAQRMEEAGQSVMVIGNDRHICGIISVADVIRPEAREAIRGMTAAGIQNIVMLTGDNRGTAKAVANEVGITDFRAELLPEDKLNAIQEILKKYGETAMVGDGVNDAPALAIATVGIAMGTAGSDAAIETADIALMTDDLTKLAWLVAHARRSLRVIRQNIFFALGVKVVFMTLALFQVATLWMAIAADMGSSLLVVFNALTLLTNSTNKQKGSNA